MTVKSLSQVRSDFFSLLRDGTRCPCCDRYAKIYRRKLNSSMAITLIRMAKHERKHPGWIHMLSSGNFGLPSRDYGTLVHWELTEERGDLKGDGNPDSGYYRLTKDGRLFVARKIHIQKYIYLYNNRLIEIKEPEAEEMTSIEEALGSKFSYEELMKS